MTKLRTLGAAAVLALGMATQAVAAPIFDYNPVNFGGTNATYQGNELVGRFSTAFTSADSFASFTATGWGQIRNINVDSVAQSTGGLASDIIPGDYHLWYEFTYTASGGPGGSIAPFYNIDSISIDLYAGSGTDRDFVLATATVAPTVTTNSGSEVLLGSGSTILGGGIVNFRNQSLLAADLDFELVELGKFFTAPDPFFNLAFQSASTVLPSVNFTKGTGFLNGTNEIRFDRTIPEPATLALMGLGLLGIGAVSKRRKA